MGRQERLDLLLFQRVCAVWAVVGEERDLGGGGRSGHDGAGERNVLGAGDVLRVTKYSPVLMKE